MAFFQTNDLLKGVTYFKPFSRYRPFYFEVDLDGYVLNEYFKQPLFAGPRVPDWKQVLNSQYIIDYTQDPHPPSLVIDGKRGRDMALGSRTKSDPRGQTYVIGASCQWSSSWSCS